MGRLRHVIDNANIDLILTNSDADTARIHDRVRSIDINDTVQRGDGHGVRSAEVGPDDIAYVLYTSGSDRKSVV